MADILKDILKELPSKAIETANFEGANIVLYTKDKRFFHEGEGQIRKIVNTIKKRIELRADEDITVNLPDGVFKLKFSADREYRVTNMNPDSSGDPADYKKVTVKVIWEEPAETQ